MNRRTLLGGLAGASFATSLGAQVVPEHLAAPNNVLTAPWAAWKAAFLEDSGRVIDTLQQGASHSESQGYGLLLAAIFGDDPAFDQIYQWTEANLAIRSDALLAWRWLPTAAGRVPDRNNASDGDLFYAWGLVIRGERDGRPEFLDRATAIATDLVQLCVIRAQDGSGRLLLIPAAQGFDRDAGQIVNPSYYMPRAMREVARATGVAALATCASDGEMLIAELAEGGLVPDWIQIGATGVETVEGMSDRNGYEAMRVPLFLSWSGNAVHPAVVRQAEAYERLETVGELPFGTYATVMDRVTGAVLETSTNVGYGAVSALVGCAARSHVGAPIPLYQAANQPYYPATLHLMTLIAQVVSVPKCLPI